MLACRGRRAVSAKRGFRAMSARRAMWAKREPKDHPMLGHRGRRAYRETPVDRKDGKGLLETPAVKDRRAKREPKALSAIPAAKDRLVIPEPKAMLGCREP